jgi:uncharacterized membrane protein YfcA
VKTSTKIFLALGVWGVAIGAIYWFITYEPAGTVLLGVFGLMGLVVALYSMREGALRTRRPEAPEDRDDATPADAAGRRVGSFHFESAWPLWFSAGAALVAAGLAYGLYLIPVGAVAMIVAVLGLMRESRG